MVYEDAPRRREIEDIIETTMAGHIQLTGSTLREREMILEVSHVWQELTRQESRRITEALRQRQEQASAGHPPPAWPIPLDDPFAGWLVRSLHNTDKQLVQLGSSLAKHTGHARPRHEPRQRRDGYNQS
jgi:hypothetical protein